MTVRFVQSYIQHLLWGFSSFADSGGGLACSKFSFATCIFGWFCWEPCVGCGVGFTFLTAGFTFWSEGCVDLTATETWDTGLWWLTGRWTRWGPFETPRTLCCGVGATIAICDCWDTGIRFGPSLLACNQKEIKYLSLQSFLFYNVNWKQFGTSVLSFACAPELNWSFKPQHHREYNLTPVSTYYLKYYTHSFSTSDLDGWADL